MLCLHALLENAIPSRKTHVKKLAFFWSEMHADANSLITVIIRAEEVRQYLYLGIGRNFSDVFIAEDNGELAQG